MSRSGLWQVKSSQGLLCGYWERIVDPNATYREDLPGDYDLKFQTSSPPYGPPVVLTKPNGHDRDWHLIRFRYAFHDGTGEPWPSVVHSVTIPFWFVCAIALVLPLTKAIALIRAHKSHRIGLCVKCGYDLRAPSEVCPECGTPIAGCRSSPE